MKTVSTRAIIDILHFLDLKGHPLKSTIVPAKLPGIPEKVLQPETLLNPRNHLSWDIYAQILESLAPLFPDDRIREYMEWSIASKAKWTAVFRPIARLFTSPRNIYLIVPWATALQYANIKVKTRFQRGRRAFLEFTFLPNDRPSDLFLRFTAKALEVLPMLAGFKPSIVQFETDGSRTTFEITYFTAIPMSLFKRLTLPLRTLLNARALLSGLEQREAEIRLQHLELESKATKFAQEASAHSAQYKIATGRLELLMRHSPDLIITVGRDKRITYMNRFLAGYEPEQVIGKSCLDYVPPESQNAYSELLDAAFQGHTGSMEVPITDHTWFLTRVIPIKENDSIDQVLAISSDITKIKLSEQRLNEAKELALSASRAKSAFIANVSHEIRTPLASVIGFAELLVSDPAQTPENQKEFCRRILTSGQHLLGLVTDILDISKIEAGSVTLNTDKFQPVDVINEVVSSFTVQANLKGLRLSADLDKLNNIEAIADAMRLRQLLYNLIGNAIKFTAKGEIIIQGSLKAAPLAPTRTILSVAVTDTGCGIDMTNSAFVFAPFEQYDNSATRKFGGSGLGLFLSRQIARQMGGDVVLTESIPGKGSTFTLTILLDSPSPSIERERLAPIDAIGSKINAAGKSILLVEDNIDLAHLLRIHIESAGYKPMVAHDGRDAVDQATRTTPDLILMDLHLPVMDGYEALKTLRQKGLTIPIIALTANAREEDRQRCLEMGFTAYWAKPMPRDQLLNSVARFFE